MMRNKTGYKLVDHSVDVKNATSAQIEKALEMCGLEAERNAKINITNNKSIDTGNLRNSITHKVEGKTCFIGTNVEYGIYVELGTGTYYPGGRRTPWKYQDSHGSWHITKGQKAKPYLKPAIADHLDTYKKIIKDTLKGK